ncbi:MAG TPA: nitrogen fixation protein NifZ [Gammaproteobacteria bacterium]|nr:nitrogen fixation protein NifZ [Gammaproteobacteria bacterium]
MRPEYDYGDAVRVLRNVRNDGTYPGLDRGTLLVKRGSVGYVQNVGTFLQDQVIYSVHFMDIDRIIGCRAEELQPENDPWVPSRFEFRERVVAALPLGKQGNIVVEQGAEGEIEKVLRDIPEGVFYYVRFRGRTLQVPESAIAPVLLSEQETADQPPEQV